MNASAMSCKVARLLVRAVVYLHEVGMPELAVPCGDGGQSEDAGSTRKDAGSATDGG